MAKKVKRPIAIGYEVTSISPGWIKRTVPSTYADEGLKRIVLFYVINTPCIDLSSSGLPMSHYKWGKDVWRKSALKDQLFSAGNLERGKNFVSIKKTDEMKSACKSTGMDGKFYKNREKQKIVFYKPSRYNEFLAVFYHIRNALAHGRLAMYPIKDEEDIMFVMEDGIKKNGDFYVRSRMILRKSTLLSWIDIIERKVENQSCPAESPTNTAKHSRPC